MQTNISRDTVHLNIGDSSFEGFIFLTDPLNVSIISSKVFLESIPSLQIGRIVAFELMDESQRFLPVCTKDEMDMVGHQDESQYFGSHQVRSNGNAVHPRLEIIVVQKP